MKNKSVIIWIIVFIVCITSCTMVYFSNKQNILNMENENVLHSNLYKQTEKYLKDEFDRVYSPYQEILDLYISDWNEENNEATFFYNMVYKYFEQDVDTIEYIKKEKENGNIEMYELLKKEYLEPHYLSYDFKIVLENDELKLYTNVAAKGESWEPITIDEYVK